MEGVTVLKVIEMFPGLIPAQVIFQFELLFFLS